LAEPEAKPYFQQTGGIVTIIKS